MTDPVRQASFLGVVLGRPGCSLGGAGRASGVSFLGYMGIGMGTGIGMGIGMGRGQGSSTVTGGSSEPGVLGGPGGGGGTPAGGAGVGGAGAGGAGRSG